MFLLCSTCSARLLALVYHIIVHGYAHASRCALHTNSICVKASNLTRARKLDLD